MRPGFLLYWALMATPGEPADILRQSEGALLTPDGLPNREGSSGALAREVEAPPPGEDGASTGGRPENEEPVPPKTPPNGGPDPVPPPEPELRDPEGSILIGLSGGASFSSDFRYGSVGLQLGYAVLTGVVPGVRTTLLFGDLSGGEVVGTLWLTPPVAFPVVPFAVGESGYAWRDIGDVGSDGAMYGAGGGIHLGRPSDVVNLRVGLIYRYYDFGIQRDVLSPIIVGSFRF